MKASIYILMYVLCICSCSKSNYYGYVYDFDKKEPLEGVKVYDMYNKKAGKTDEKGYFQLHRTKNSSSILIFQKEHYRSDTIRSINIQSGELMEEKFKGEKIYLFKANSAFRDSILKANQVN
ncbi:carboxypeptidase-like regulatory domain-containing protein [Agrobacterium tumefaciens]|nr:carboxypeptidase-like regulatory domain-containing protein [Agrobacterium tumefaciens]NTE18263.1 carboxypeptidase-like regulatory domain-containing protein [Agrobacterium tumefaciens]